MSKVIRRIQTTKVTQKLALADGTVLRKTHIIVTRDFDDEVSNMKYYYVNSQRVSREKYMMALPGNFLLQGGWNE